MMRILKKRTYMMNMPIYITLIMNFYRLDRRMSPKRISYLTLNSIGIMKDPLEMGLELEVTVGLFQGNLQKVECHYLLVILIS